ncbi:hypothetical protein PV387_23070 [Streptomyces sp. ME02-6987-2C]|uniref:hypothetical protein n=1 Tax=unclassified Streptomyces TaxID=2593676 RepID=UPI0029BE7C0E|nr:MULTISPECIES: hypothetical protein [unclassified Streptomyces]MDX3368884.1 hypothetical protein [Streptomyces sp. ME02-6987-2C]MDX3421738.1 hypothetical protein [Streptomyces sp. ME02-6985-2c]
MNRPGAGGLRFGMFAVCVIRDSEPELNKGKAKSLYDLLVTYADCQGRDTGQGYPYREALAGFLDCSPQTIDRATKYLEQEIGLITVVRRKVADKPDENDANLYLIHDAWLIHCMPAPADTPPQLVARYGHTVPGFDVEAWMAEYAPDFDLAGWTTAHAARKNVQQEEQQERRRKDRARKRKATTKKRGGVTGDVTPSADQSVEGDVTGDGTCHVTHDVSGGVTGDALSTAVPPEPVSGQTSVADAEGQSAGGYARAGAPDSAPSERDLEDGGSAASGTDIPTQRTTSPRPKAVKTRPRGEVTGFDVVRAAIPQSVAGPGTRLYSGLHRAINELLTGDEATGVPRRSPDQVIARINRRWYGQNAEERSASGYTGEDRIRSRSSWLAEAIRRQDCPDLSCEDGQIIGTESSCRTCRERREEAHRVRQAATEAAARWQAETEASRAAAAATERWEAKRADEERRLRADLRREGVYGAKLDHQVAKHMARWREGNPQTAESSAQEHSTAEDTGALSGYSPPNDEYLAWRKSQTATLPAAIARARADKAARRDTPNDSGANDR